MATKQKNSAEFKRESRDGKYVYVKRLAFGGEVHKCGDTFEAYDKNGRYLGELIASQEDAEYMAHHGFVVSTAFDDVCELSLWVLWEDARKSGACVMQGANGEQVMSIRDDIYLIAVDGRNGWETELVTDVELARRYYDDEHQCFSLRMVPSDKVFIVE